MGASGTNKSCIKCQKPVNSKEIAVVCGLWCKKSFHNDCAGLSNSEARVMKCSKQRIKFHCEACENRLGTELFGAKETHEPKELENGANKCLLKIVQNILKVTNELSNDNSLINRKLDTILSSNARLEESLLQSPKFVEKRREESPDNSVEYVEESDTTERITEISEQNDDTNSHYQSVNSKQMCSATESQQSDDSSSLHIASDFTKQLTGKHHQNVAEGCSSDSLQEWEVSVDHSGMQYPLTIGKECLQEREVPDYLNGTQDPLRVDKEECSPSEDFLSPNTFNIEKTEDMQDEEAVREDDLEECSASEDFLRPNTFSVVKTEDMQDEEAVREDDLEEFKHEVELTSNDSKTESAIPIAVKDEKSNDDSGALTARTGNRIQCTTKEEASCRNNRSTKRVVHKCAICKKTFPQLQDLQEHIHMNRCEITHFCTVCHKTFTKNSHLERHFRVHTGERPYSCGVCNMSFIQNSHLKSHSQLHTGERPYSCQVCHKRFRCISTLKNHSRLHTGERPYSCGVCSMSFIQNSHLKKHSQVHTGERPYSCQVCHKRFRYVGSLKNHSRLHTGERLYSCNICQMKFSYKSKLRYHLIRHTRKGPYT